MPTVLQNKLLCYNALQKTLRSLTFSKDPDCPLCGKHPHLESKNTLSPPEDFCNSNNGVPSEVTTDTPEMNISHDKAKQLVDQGAILVDVREDFEYLAGHIPNALHMPMSQMAENRVRSMLDEHLEQKDAPFVVYCEHGKRSLYAVEWFRQLGYQHALSMSDGFSVWNGPSCQ